MVSNKFLYGVLIVSALVSLVTSLPGWTLTFSDEFNSQTKVNTAKWNVFYGFSPTPINNESQFYAPDAFAFTPSALRIVAEKRPNNGLSQYTSGAITTQNKFTQTYGYFEMRAAVPMGQGIWPAFWLLPQSSSKAQEIDIMEIINPTRASTPVYTTFHCDYVGSNPLNKGSSKNIASLADGGFHIYSVQWYPGTVIFYVDRVQVWNLTNSCIPNNPAYVLANLAIGGSWPGYPNAATVFPAYYDIDYIRVYKYNSTGGTTFPGVTIQAYNPITPDQPSGVIVLGTVLPNVETVNTGATIVFKTTIKSRNAISNNNVKIQLQPYTNGANKDTVVASGTTTFTCAAGYVNCTKDISVFIPQGLASGYYRVSIGVFSTSWSCLFWQDTVAMIGVGGSLYPVGKKA